MVGLLKLGEELGQILIFLMLIGEYISTLIIVLLLMFLTLTTFKLKFITRKQRPLHQLLHLPVPLPQQPHQPLPQPLPPQPHQVLAQALQLQ